MLQNFGLVKSALCCCQALLLAQHTVDTLMSSWRIGCLLDAHLSSAQVMKFAGEHYVPRVLDSLLEWESSKDLRGVLHTSLMLYPEKVGR